jgi:hypothetical protein
MASKFLKRIYTPQRARWISEFSVIATLRESLAFVLPRSTIDMCKSPISLPEISVKSHWLHLAEQPDYRTYPTTSISPRLSRFPMGMSVDASLNIVRFHSFQQFNTIHSLAYTTHVDQCSETNSSLIYKAENKFHTWPSSLARSASSFGRTIPAGNGKPVNDWQGKFLG